MRIFNFSIRPALRNDSLPGILNPEFSFQPNKLPLLNSSFGLSETSAAKAELGLLFS
jgi:hypothetical protein